MSPARSIHISKHHVKLLNTCTYKKLPQQSQRAPMRIFLRLVTRNTKQRFYQYFTKVASPSHENKALAV